MANLVRNPRRGQLKDALMVAANPYCSPVWFEQEGLGTYPLAGCIDVWQDGWDEDRGCVPPEAIYRAARDAVREDPARRVILHFIQPHFPYIGSLSVGGEPHTEPHAPGVWRPIRSGEISVALAWVLYLENLVLAMRWVLRFLKERGGTTIITSDHGNLFGEYGLVWHPPRLYVPELTRVPWLRIRG